MAAGVTSYNLKDGRACLVYYVEGKRRRETFTSKREAQARAREVEALKDKGHKIAPRAKAAGDDTARYCQELLDAAGVDRPLTSLVEEYLAAYKALNGKGTLLEAAESLRCARSAREERPAITVPALREEYRAYLLSLNLTPNYINKACSVYLGKFARAFPAATIASLTIADLKGWWAKIPGTGKTRNNYRNAVRALFSFARDHEYLPREKATEASFLGKAKESGAGANPFTPAEMALLLTNAEEDDLPFLVIGGFAGVRTEEQLKMVWEKHVDWEQQVFVLDADITKLSKRRVVPMLPVAQAWLKPFWGRKGPILGGEHPTRHPGQVLRAHGLAWRHNGLRDGFASYRAAMIQDLAKVAREMGNSPTVVMNSYHMAVAPQAAAQWWELTPERARVVAPSVPRAKCPSK